MRGKVIRSLEEARLHDRRAAALVEVPGELVHVVVALMQVLREPGDLGPVPAAAARGPLPRRDRGPGPGPGGIIVTNIGPGSQAAMAGMARGDVLLRYDGVPIDRPARLRNLTKRLTGPGETSSRVVIDAMRGPAELRFEVHGGPLGMTVSSLFSSPPRG